MKVKIEAALDALNKLAECSFSHEEYYHLMVSNLTTDAIHAARHINPEDLKTLAKFAEDVKIFQKWDKEK